MPKLCTHFVCKAWQKIDMNKNPSIRAFMSLPGETLAEVSAMTLPGGRIFAIPPVPNMIRELEKINLEVKSIAEKTGKDFYYGRFIQNNKAIFVGEMPTPSSDWNPRANFDLTRDQNFLNILNKHGFGGCYITDIVKIVSKSRRPTLEELKIFLPILKLEIEIIKPKIIVALGDDAYKILIKNGIKAEKILHPSYPRRYNRWKKYESQFEQLAVLIS